jgi:hypothetical protein
MFRSLDSMEGARRMTIPIPLICERCRREGVAGKDLFERYADLLDFEPVPRRPRADGWDAEVQRAFILVLAATGSPRQAAAAVGKAQFGFDQLKRAKGNESFMAAVARALDVHAEEKSRRLREGVAAVAGPAANWRPPAPVWANAARRGRPPAGRARANDEKEEMTDEEKWDFLCTLVDRYLIKIRAERRERLAGNIVAADFYLRQATHIEVMFDLIGGDGFHVLAEYRHRGRHLADIAHTPFTLLIDEARRAKWEEFGEPSRPVVVPPEWLKDEDDGVSTEPREAMMGGADLKALEEERKAERKRLAAEQIAWEAEACQAAADWREAEAGARQEPSAPACSAAVLGSRAEPGRPACDLQVDRTDVTNDKVREAPHPSDRSGGAIGLVTVRDGPPEPDDEAQDSPTPPTPEPPDAP